MTSSLLCIAVRCDISTAAVHPVGTMAANTNHRVSTTGTRHVALVDVIIMLPPMHMWVVLMVGVSLNQTTQHWHTGSVCKCAVPAYSSRQVYESHVD